MAAGFMLTCCPAGQKYGVMLIWLKASAANSPLLPKSVASLLSEVRACSVCAQHLPLGPRPIVQVHACASILIVSQAPSAKRQVARSTQPVSRSMMQVETGCAHGWACPARFSTIQHKWPYFRWVSVSPEPGSPETCHHDLSVRLYGGKHCLHR
jgi:hypothetical protein